MFSYGILIETRVFGELIPLVVCATALITEEMLVVRMRNSEYGARRRRTSEAAQPIHAGWAEEEPGFATAKAMRQNGDVLQESF
jgi:hypothetical protein